MVTLCYFTETVSTYDSFSSWRTLLKRDIKLQPTVMTHTNDAQTVQTRQT